LFESATIEENFKYSHMKIAWGPIATMYRVKVATLEEFSNCKEQWNSLVKSMKRPSVFCTWEWVHTWWEHFGGKYKAFIFFVYDNDYLIGILPLGLRRMVPEDGLVPVRVLSFFGTYEVYPDNTDFIYPGDDAGVCLKAVLEFLSTTFRNWDVLHFSHVAEDNHLLQFFSSIRSCLQSQVRAVSTAPYIPLESKFENDFEKYLQSLSRNKRHDLRRRRRGLHAKSGINYVHSIPGQSGVGIEQLFKLHSNRARKKRIKSSFQGEKLLRFHSKISETFEKEGFLFLRFLNTGSTAVAALYCFLFEGRLFAYQSGLDPNWESKGVGSVLMLEAISEAAECGLNEFDFLRGGETYKEVWTSEARTLYDVWVYNTTARSTLFRLSCRARSVIKKIIRLRIF
jgi:hypothetical protein